METWELLEHEVSVTEDGYGIRFRVDCRPPCELTRLLRCYGEGSPKDLLVGVLEPKNGRLFLERKISREALRQSESGGVPTRFYLSDGGARERVPPACAEPAAPEPPLPRPEPAAPEPPLPRPEPAAPEPPPGIPPQTGDALLDAVLSRGEARSEPSGDGLRITCPFSPVQPFPLAFIAPLCRTERELAILDWKPKEGLIQSACADS